MSSASQTKSQSPEEELFGPPQPRDLQVLSRRLGGVPSNREPNPSPELESREGVAQDVPMNAPAAEEAELVTEKPRRRADWTPPEGLKAFVRERQSGKSKGKKDTYYILPGVGKNFRSIAEVRRHLEKNPASPLKEKSGTQPSRPAASQESPETQIKDEDRAERPKSRPKVCVQRNMFKRSRRQRQKKLL